MISNVPLDPKTTNKEGFQALRISVITPKIEGCGFPWLKVKHHLKQIQDFKGICGTCV